MNLADRLKRDEYSCPNRRRDSNLSDRFAEIESEASSTRVIEAAEFFPTDSEVNFEYFSIRVITD